MIQHLLKMCTWYGYVPCIIMHTSGGVGEGDDDEEKFIMMMLKIII